MSWYQRCSRDILLHKVMFGGMDFFEAKTSDYVGWSREGNEKVESGFDAQQLNK